MIPLISEKILQTQQCEEFAANGLTGQMAQDEIFQRMHPTHNVDLVIRTRFLHRVRDRIHDKVCEYLHQSTQLLISDHRQDFMKSDLSAQATGSQSNKDVLTLLRLLDCLTWDRQSPDEEQVYYTNYKNETTKAIKEIANKSMDLRVIKMAASVLGASVRAWPVDCKDAKGKFFHNPKF